MLSKIWLIIKFILGLVDTAKVLIYKSKVAKREKLLEDLKDDNPDNDLDALDKLQQ